MLSTRQKERKNMSLDLTIASAMNTTPQTVTDQDGAASNMSLASNAVTLGTNEAYQTNAGSATLTTYADHGFHALVVERPAAGSDSQRTCFMATVGDEEAFRFDYSSADQLLIKVNGTQVMVLDSTGNLAITGALTAQLQPESAAPSGANLQSVQVDVSTGVFYYD